MLREMRDAAGDSGEFYTPRPVVRFMVQVSDPRLGETVLDPACGTGGFLVETYYHIAPQVSTPDQRRVLQQHARGRALHIDVDRQQPGAQRLEETGGERPETDHARHRRAPGQAQAEFIQAAGGAVHHASLA